MSGILFFLFMVVLAILILALHEFLQGKLRKHYNKKGTEKAFKKFVEDGIITQNVANTLMEELNKE